MWNPYFYSLGGLAFYLYNRQTQLQGPFFPETNEEEICIFWPKSSVDPLKKSNMATTNWINDLSGLYSLGGLHVYAKFIDCELFDESQIYLYIA